MTFRLTIDGPRWNQTLREVHDSSPGLVPVIKGNGYGFGIGRLAGRCAVLDVPTVAVGLTSEIDAVRAVYPGDILVLAPLQRAELPGLETVPDPDGRLLRTVAHGEILGAVADLAAPPRVVLELDSPMHRHGIAPAELPFLAPALARVPFAGAAIHLPASKDRRWAAQTALRAITDVRSAGIVPGTLWVSHLSPEEIAWVRQQDPQTQIRARVGTGLWLADRSTFTVTGSVLDTHPIQRREAIGHRQRRASGGTLIVVAGGSAHGVGLQSSIGRGRWRDLARGAMTGAAHGAGWTASPFRWADRRLQFADVPHMQISMLIVPAGTAPPRIGDRLLCSARMTVATFDEIHVVEADPNGADPNDGAGGKNRTHVVNLES